MPQFDIIIIFPIIKDLIFILTLYYVVFTHVIITNIKALKFRKKASIFLTFKLSIAQVFRSYFLNQ